MEINKLLTFLACPYCNNQDLKLISPKKLTCPKCSQSYPIINNIPVLINKKNLDPQEKKQTIWFDKHYSQFKDKNQLENWRISMLNRIFKQKFSKKIKTYLDIGCGATGYTVIEAAKQNNWLSFGVDISLEAMIKSQHFAEIQNVGSKTAFVVSSAQNLPFKKNIFDYISAISLLEHLEDDKKAINQIKYILKKNKFLYICVPNTYLKIWPFIWPFYYFNDIKIGHKRHYSIKQLNKLLKEFNFQLKTNFYNGHLIKFLQLFLEKTSIISNKLWWKIEKIDINNNSTGVQLNAIYQKK
ncbi:MAG: methyltransferase domain-containing protein [Candidatus Shapirobacteria bacterium]|nr:methyltransferase domain-containing protein [Candidatus Shapirobacteria bacterium]